MDSIFDWNQGRFRDIEWITRKLDYFRQVSKNLSKLDEHSFRKIGNEFESFLNFTPTAGAEYSDLSDLELYRISLNQSIPGPKGPGKRLERFSQLLAPPPSVSKLNRCNLPGESIFYCTLDEMTAFWETKPKKNQFITVTKWKFKKNVNINLCVLFKNKNLLNRNYLAQKVFEDYQVVSTQWSNEEFLVIDTVLDFLTEEFIKYVPDSNSKEYLFTATYVSLLLRNNNKDNLQFSGVIYPSIKMKHRSSNIAIKPEIILDILELQSIQPQFVEKVNYEEDSIWNGTFADCYPVSTPTSNIDYKSDRIIYDGQIPQSVKYLDLLFRDE